MRRLLQVMSLGATLVLLVLLPVEVVRPVLDLRLIRLTNLEILVLLALVLWLAQWLVTDHHLPRPLPFFLLPGMLLLGLAVLSGLLAPSHKMEALKSAGRLALALLGGVIVWQQVRARAQSMPLSHALAPFLWAIVVGAGVSAVAGLVERAFPTPPLLLLFKAQPSSIGGELRVSGTFQFATIASMYWEMVLPVALILTVTAGRRVGRILALLAGAILVSGILLSLTRSGMVVVILTLAGMVVLSVGQPLFRPLYRPAVLVGGVLVVVLAWLAVESPAFRSRFASENDFYWYGAIYDVPPAFSLPAGETAHVRLALENTGRTTWAADGTQPFELRYRWLTGDGSRGYDLPFGIVPLPHDVRPGERVQLEAAVSAPLPPGDYRLAWEMWQQDVFGFTSRGILEAESLVEVRPGDTTLPLPGTTPREGREALLPRAKPVERGRLWATAGQMFLQRPLTGHGLNNFRHLYGPLLGLEVWDTRTSANNLYLEMLADLGLPGLLVLLWLLGSAGRVVLNHLQQPAQPATGTLVVVGIAAGLLAFALHGLFDYFLEFMGVQLLFWVLLGLLAVLQED